MSPGQWIYKIPDSVPDESAVYVDCAASTVAYALHQVSLSLGAAVVIQGAGGLGLSAAPMAKDMGAAQVIVVDMIPERLALAKAFGADYTINAQEYPTPEARIQRVWRAHRGRRGRYGNGGGGLRASGSTQGGGNAHGRRNLSDLRAGGSFFLQSGNDALHQQRPETNDRLLDSQAMDHARGARLHGEDGKRVLLSTKSSLTSSGLRKWEKPTNR